MVILALTLVLGLLAEDVSGSCPWLCFCYLKATPITANCSGVGFVNFPLEIDSRVQWMDLKDNEISSISNLDKYTELEVLELAGNRISRISTTAFRKLTKLKYLDLSNNSFTHWAQINTRALLLSTIRLSTLKLSYNSLKTFTAAEGKFFVKSSSLEELHLKSCEIELFDGNSLNNFTRLKYLDLSHNPIRWLYDLSSKTLSYLDVSHCQIDSMNRYALTNLPSITTLKISGNSEFDMNFGNLTSGSLQSFEAAYCSLTSPGLYGLPNVTYANLRGNKIETLKERTFIKNKILVELDLSSNDIKVIQPEAFTGARHLAFVNLSSNSLNTIPWNAFSTNYNLKVLDLSASKLEKVGNLSILGLEYLDISHCSIKEILKDSLTGLPWLMYLNLSYNPLEKIPDDIQSWSLRSVDLSYCRLSVITNETFKRFPEIETINLTGNRFTNPFKTYMFDYNERLESLKLGDNPWICNCSSQDFKALWDFLKSYPVKVKSYEEKDLKCMSPDSLTGRSWISACYMEWYPINKLDDSSYFGLTHYGSVLIIMVIIVAGVIAVLQAIKHGIRQRLKQEEEEIQRELRQVQPETSEVYYQRRQTFPFLEAEEAESRSPRPPVRARTESELTQPPTYEEAIQMLNSSREDVVSSEDVVPSASGQGQEHSDNEDEDGQSYSIGSELSDSDEDVPKHVTRNKHSHNSM